jgi:hypothetical protein
VAYLTAPRALAWWRAGFALLRIAPWRFALWSLMPLAVEVLLQLVPGVGIVASKLVTPIASAATWLAYDGLVRRQPVPPDALAAGLRRVGARNLAGLAVLGLAIYAVQVAVALAFYGAPAWDLTVLGRTEGNEALLADRRLLLVLVLTGLAPAVVLLFVTPLVVLGGRDIGRAVSQSAGAMLSSPGALALTYGTTALALAAAIAGSGLLLLLLVPLLGAVYLAAYRDVYGAT